MLIGQSIGSGANRFDIVEELGSGAMGSVYRAQWHQEGKTKQIALKVVALGLLGNEGAMARFDREANILKQLRHPHIVKLYATGTYRKAPFIAMEFIDGEPLDRVLARRGRITWEEVVTFGKQLCGALQYAHEKGIIHRDLKPSNLMITREGVLKLTDFGIAKDTDVTALTGQNSTIGTASYMSPEQCKGDKNLSNKSDLYSLGVVFFELLSGKKPFYADNTVDMFLKHVNEPPPRIGKLVNELPSKLEALILQLMEKDKDDRPVDAAWVVRLLGEIEEDAFTRKSAGLGAATARRTKRQKNFDGSQIDDSDRDAARALRGKKKKAKKKANEPFFQRKWVKATGLLLALAGIVCGAYLAFKPPAPEKLIAALDAAETPEAKLEAATKFLERYGERPGELTDKAAAVFRDAKTRERDKQMNNRFASNMSKPTENDDPDAYNLAWKAMEAEKAGMLKPAAELWAKVKARFPDEEKLAYALKEDTLAKARWGWLADKRLDDLKKVEQLASTLRTKIAENLKFELPFTADPTSPEGLAIKGIRLEDFDDREKAIRTCWEQLAAATEKESDKRDWYLLACQQRLLSAQKAPDDPVQARLELIKKKLDKAAALAKEVTKDPEQKVERANVREWCREVIDLYDDETESSIKDQVKRAKEIALMVPRV
jgi:eukaryotic-like serine/threonine-protein kinase